MTKEKKLSFFDYLNSINSSSDKDLMEGAAAEGPSLPDPDSPEKAYNSFMVNRGLSYFQDTILYANEMNRASHLSPRMQYDFLRHGIRPRKRFSKWFKAIPAGADLEIIMKHYGYSLERAQEVLPLFSKDDLASLHKLYDKGGRVKSVKL